jgi:hypothetical protein
MEPYFQKFATLSPPSASIKERLKLKSDDLSLFVGYGPVQVSYNETIADFSHASIDGFAELLNQAVASGPDADISTFSTTAFVDAKTRTRSYAGNTYYNPEVAARKNLQVLTKVMVEKVLLTK